MQRFVQLFAQQTYNIMQLFSISIFAFFHILYFAQIKTWCKTLFYGCFIGAAMVFYQSTVSLGLCNI
jgi:hypothetical protein